MREWLKFADEIDVDCIHQYEYLLGRPLRDFAEYLEIDDQVDEMILDWPGRTEFFAAYPDLEVYRKGREKDGSRMLTDHGNDRSEPQTGCKWFLEVVQEPSGTYYANMVLDGKRVEGLPEHVNYKALRNAIRKKTGVVILEKKEMRFEAHNGKRYAFLDATQQRPDCRVSLFDIRNGFYGPRFDTGTDKAPLGATVFIYPHANHACDLNAPCILAGKIVNRTPEISCEAVARKGSVTIHVTQAIHPDNSRTKLNTHMAFSESSPFYTLSLEEAKEKAVGIYSQISAIKALPVIREPSGSKGSDYFDVVDYKRLSDIELLNARDLAKSFVGPQSRAVDLVYAEMLSRFEKRALQQAKGDISSSFVEAPGPGAGLQSNQGKTIDLEKLKAYLEDEMILEFNSPEECMDFFNTYDFQHFKSIAEMKAYQAEYGFGIGDKWYHICYEDALDVWKKPSLSELVRSADAKKGAANPNSEKAFEPFSRVR